jgi:very-short-patch-repair endonuclease
VGVRKALPLWKGEPEGVPSRFMTELFNRFQDKKKRVRLRSEMTETERLLWMRLRGRQLLDYKFRRQFSIGPFIVDFYCPRLRLALEVDGDSHFLSSEAEQYDRQRQSAIEDLGIKVLRFTNEEVKSNLEGVLKKILEEIKQPEPPPAPPS